MKKTIVALGLVAVMIFGVAYAYAQGPGFGPKYKGLSPEETCSSLTPEQKTKFQELRSKFDEETAQMRGAMVNKRLELQSLWTDPKADPKAILDKEKELRDLQNQMMDKATQMKLEARNFLTPEQLAQFGSGCGMGRGRMMAGRGRMMGAGRGMGPGMCY
jgi:Spy/CpxP family protein refolding chaperone